MRPTIKTYAGERFSNGKCVACVEGTFVSFIDAAKSASDGKSPLCQSETGRLAHFCEKHRPWTFFILGKTC